MVKGGLPHCFVTSPLESLQKSIAGSAFDSKLNAYFSKNLCNSDASFGAKFTLGRI